MSTLPLKLISSFMVLVGTGALIALLIPSTAQYMNPKFPIAITASITMATGVGLWVLKKWAIYLFFGSALITYAANIISFGQPLIGKSWIGLLVIGVLGCVYWKKLS